MPPINREGLERAFNKMPDSFVVIHDWSSLVGSLVYGKETPGDIDVVLRSDAPSGALIKLERALREALGGDEPVQFIHSPSGPNWAAMPMYDLIAVKKQSFSLVQPNEPEFAEDFYKGFSPFPMSPFSHYKAWKEFHKGQEQEVWDDWGVKYPHEKLIVQPKSNGIRLHIHKQGDKIAAFTEENEDRANVLVGLDGLLSEFDSIILDVEAVGYSEKGPNSRWEMGWLVEGRPPQKKASVVLWVHDLLFLEGKSLASDPYLERLRFLSRILPKDGGELSLRLMPTKVSNSKESLEKALEWACSQKEQNSEGAMIKVSSFSYGINRLPTICKYRTIAEIDYAVIGYRKIPAAKPQNVRWTKKQAQKMLPGLLEKSHSYAFRVALVGVDGNLVPVEGNAILSRKDLSLDWDEKKQEWTGTEDRRLWKMFHGFENRGEGELVYGSTYACKVMDESALREGLVVSVRPRSIQPFKAKGGGWHLSHHHPGDPVLRSPDTEADSVEKALKAYGLNPQEYRGLT